MKLNSQGISLDNVEYQPRCSLPVADIHNRKRGACLGCDIHGVMLLERSNAAENAIGGYPALPQTRESCNVRLPSLVATCSGIIFYQDDKTAECCQVEASPYSVNFRPPRPLTPHTTQKLLHPMYHSATKTRKNGKMLSVFFAASQDVLVQELLDRQEIQWARLQYLIKMIPPRFHN